MSLYPIFDSMEKNYLSELKTPEQDFGEKASKGDPKSLFEVGLKYYFQDLKPDSFYNRKESAEKAEKVALKFFGVAAESGYAPAQFKYGYLLMYGIAAIKLKYVGLSNDPVGLQWIKKAADQMNADAHIFLAARKSLGSKKIQLESLKKINLEHFDATEKSKIERKISELHQDFNRIVNLANGTVNEFTKEAGGYWETDKWEAMRLYGLAYEKILQEDANDARRWGDSYDGEIGDKMWKDLYVPIWLFKKHYNNLKTIKKISENNSIVLKTNPKSYADFETHAAAYVELDRLGCPRSRHYLKEMYSKIDETRLTVRERDSIREMLNRHWSGLSWNFQQDVCQII